MKALTIASVLFFLTACAPHERREDRREDRRDYRQSELQSAQKMAQLKLLPNRIRATEPA